MCLALVVARRSDLQYTAARSNTVPHSVRVHEHHHRGLYEMEVIHRRGPWRGFDDSAYATLEWVAWFNSQRLLEPRGNVPPSEYEEQFYRAKAVTVGRCDNSRENGDRASATTLVIKCVSSDET